MKKFLSLLLALSLLVGIFVSAPIKVSAATPVSTNGALSVKNGKVVNSKGKEFVIKGVSTHGLAWYPQYVNKAAFKTLRDKWGVNTIRLALYSAEYGGYCSGGNQTELKKLVSNGVSYAKELGMYVIIDWHILSDGNPLTNKTQAVSFFKWASKKYASYNNVMYEICNEPNGSGGNWTNIKTYSKSVIKTIRTYDKDAIIIVGTPTWSQDVDTAASSPLSGYKNIAYAFHFYAATHKENMRAKLESALKKGLPVIVTEFGISEASGNGSVSTTEGDKWIKLLDKYKVGRVAWNLSNKSESCALIKSSCTKTSGWATTDLTTQGKWLVKKYTGGSTYTPEKPQPSVSGEPDVSSEGTLSCKTSGNIKLKATVSSINSWKSGDYYFTQYNIRIKNIGTAKCSSWKFTMNMRKSFSMAGDWCGTFTKNSLVLTVKPLSWNKVLTSGQGTELGFIVKSKSRESISKISLSAS
ncbi:MAG: cellulase family glycosylhydrolase [Clostridia bacterium]|nr:cellulase family glycosylhydrolase [Clostridia bacterium]